MQSIRTLIAPFCIVAAGCVSNPAPSAPAAPVAAAYGVMQVHFIDNNVIRDSAYPPGVYDVPLDADKAMAFDNDSTGRTAICARADNKPFELSSGNVKHYRFQCDTSWNSRGVMFVADTNINIKRSEMLVWKKLDGEPPLARPRSVDTGCLGSSSSSASCRRKKARHLRHEMDCLMPNNARLAESHGL